MVQILWSCPGGSYFIAIVDCAIVIEYIDLNLHWHELVHEVSLGHHHVWYIRHIAVSVILLDIEGICEVPVGIVVIGKRVEYHSELTLWHQGASYEYIIISISHNAYIIVYSDSTFLAVNNGELPIDVGYQLHIERVPEDYEIALRES